ncbi:hypothetical protein F5Y05DRAFT_384472 [Hypoxylon sp. FL0543]|nr:hypothetical protein F5Y05DRAFT_384472 [Hypoxylon sp. FL0543]
MRNGASPGWCGVTALSEAMRAQLDPIPGVNFPSADDLLSLWPQLLNHSDPEVQALVRLAEEGAGNQVGPWNASTLQMLLGTWAENNGLRRFDLGFVENRPRDRVREWISSDNQGGQLLWIYNTGHNHWEGLRDRQRSRKVNGRWVKASPPKKP